MKDPTPLTITLSFVISLLIGIAGAIWMRVKRPSPGQPPPLRWGKVQVWFYHPFDLIGPALVVVAFCGLFLLSLQQPKTSAVNMPTLELMFGLIFSMGFQFAMAAIMILIAAQRISINRWLGLRWADWYRVFLIAPGCVLGMWALMWGMENAGYSDWIKSIGVEVTQDTVKLFQESKSIPVLALMTFLAVFVAPICEEIVFRGFFYPVLKKFSGVTAAAICCSLFFAAAHGELGSLIPLFLLSLVLIWTYEFTGSIWAPISVHFCFNAATVVGQLLYRLLQVSDLQAPQ